MSAALAGGFAAAANATRERGEQGFREIQRRADLLMDLLSALPRVRLRSPRPAQGGLVSFEAEGVEAKETVERLLEQRFVLRYVPARVPYVRASTHLFNTERELEALTEAVGRL